MPPDVASDLSSLLATLHGFEDTFADFPNKSIRRPTGEGGLAVALSLLRERHKTADALIFDKLLGQGGMGKVHLAEQRSVGRDVAVKSLHNNAELDAVHGHALLSEGWIMAALEHPNIPPVYDVMLDDDGSPLVLLKRIEGEEWLTLMADAKTVRERFGESLATWNLDVLDKICNALSYAHSKRIVHRDIKPENVMIGAFGEVYLLDWGIAASLDKDPDGRLPYIGDSQQPAGTPCYMAPELLAPHASSVDERADIYLLGGMLFESVVGKPPHRGTNMEKIVSSIVRSEPVFPDDAPTALAEICKRAMKAAPSERYQSVEEFQQALREYRQRRATQALTDEASARLDKLRSLAQEEPSEERSATMSSLFSECRFAFRQAIASYPGDDLAERGLDEATQVMARSALESGESDAAAALLRELRVPDASLSAELELVVTKSQEQSRRLASLERQQDSDVNNGRRIAMLIMFAVAVTLPMVGVQLLDRTAFSYAHTIPWQLFILIGFVVSFPRFELEQTEANRLTYLIITMALATELLATLSAAVAGYPLETALFLDSVCWTASGVMATLTMGWFYMPIAVGYFVGMTVIGVAPEYTYFAIAGSNLFMLLNAILIYALQITPHALIRYDSK